MTNFNTEPHGADKRLCASYQGYVLGLLVAMVIGGYSDGWETNVGRVKMAYANPFS